MPSWKTPPPHTEYLERLGTASVFLQRPGFEPLRHISPDLLPILFGHACGHSNAPREQRASAELASLIKGAISSCATAPGLDRSRVSKLEQ